MKKILSFVFLSLLFWNLLGAQESRSSIVGTPSDSMSIFPCPQKVLKTGKPLLIHKLNLLAIGREWADSEAYRLLEDYVLENQIKSKSYPITIGESQDPEMRAYKDKAPKRKEGYYLELSDKGAVVVGADGRGTYYGVLTLLQMLKEATVYETTIVDYPSIEERGVVEGFYGTPWSFEDRLSVIRFMGQMKMNIYIYGPKDDPYHSSPNWRQPYPEKEGQNIKRLVEEANKHKVKFTWAIHPGKDIKWTEDDRIALLQKFDSMYHLGVRSFAIFFDDISGEGTRADKQAELINYIHRNFVLKRKEVQDLIMCPTEYNKAWSNPEKAYLKQLGKELDKSVRIMWTGDRVVSDISEASVEWINQEISRKAFIWWNYPVTDYSRDHILLGPVYGNDKKITPMLSGFVSNPMEHAEASKIAIFSVADYCWNTEKYDVQKSWNAAMRKLMPKTAESLKIVAENMSDLGPNGHAYRREESVRLEPLLALWKEKTLRQETLSEGELYKLKHEYDSLLSSADRLLASDDNVRLLKEIEPWVRMMTYVAQFGQNVLTMSQSLLNGEEGLIDTFKKSYYRSRTLLMEMYHLSSVENQNPYQAGIKVGEKVLLAYTKEVFEYLVKHYNDVYQEQLDSVSSYQPHKICSNMVSYENQEIRFNRAYLSITPKLEYSTIYPDEYLGFELEKLSLISQFQLNVGLSELPQNMSVLVGTSLDDCKPLPIKTNNKGDVTFVETPRAKVKYVILKNEGTEPISIQLKQFRLKIE